VLAQQPTGYFVLNDIFRYINEEGDEEPGDAATAQEESTTAGPLVEDVEMPKAQPSAEEPSQVLDTDVVDKKLEEAIESAPAVEDFLATNGTAETIAEAEEAPVEATKAEEEAPAPEAVEKAVDEEIKEPEKPKDPIPSPAISRLPPTTKPAPVQPAAPPKPLSWASRAAAAVGTTPKPAVPAVAPKASTPPAQTRVAPPAAAKPAQAQITPTPATPTEKDKENNAPGAGWQTAGSDHSKRQNRPQSISTPPEKEGTMGYVKNVTEKVTADELKAALSAFGELIYFDINRGKVRSIFLERLVPEPNEFAELRLC